MSALRKKEIRRRWRSHFPYTADQKEQLSREICRHLLADPRVKGAPQVGLFAPLAWEPDVMSLLSLGNVVFPKVDATASGLIFHQVVSPADLTPGFGGILEPAASAPLAKPWSPADVMLIPGYGFDIFGARIGSGMGFYDRFLPHFPGIRLAVAFEAQISQLPLAQESFDARMAGLCTETGIRNVMP